MAHEKVQSLHIAFDELRLALDSRDAANMVAAGEAVRLACEDLRRQAVDDMDAEARGALEAILPQIEEARRRINMEADDVRQRMALLARQGVATATATYAR